MMVRFALISDVHFGNVAYFDGKLRKLTQYAAPLCERFVEEMNTVSHPDLVVNLGDVIEDESHQTDLERYAQFQRILAGLQAPILHVAGNHDTVNLTESDMRALWGHSGELYYSRDVDELHLIVLHSLEGDGKISVSPVQLSWLELDLARTERRTLVFVHHPPSEMVLDGNRWFAKAPNICRIAERRVLRKILESSGKVAAVFNGHVHWNHFDVISGIPYITLQSLTENVEDDAPGRPAATWAVCDIDDSRLHVVVAGEHAARYQIELSRRS